MIDHHVVTVAISAVRWVAAKVPVTWYDSAISGRGVGDMLAAAAGVMEDEGRGVSAHR